MATVTIQTDVGGTYSTRGLVVTDENTAYVFTGYLGPGYFKTTDAGDNWSAKVSFLAAGGASGDSSGVDIWYEKWEDSANDNVIHILYGDNDNSEVRYRSLNLDTDTLSSAVTVHNSASASILTITRAASGDLYATGWDGSAAFFYKSEDNGANWSSVAATMYEATNDRGMLLPDLSSADPADVLMIYFDSSDDDLEVKQFDDSATSVSTTAIDTTWTGRTNLGLQQIGGAALRQSDGHIIFASWDQFSTLTTNHSNLRVFDINGSSITEKTAIRTSQTGNPWQAAVTIDQVLGDIYVLFSEDTDDTGSDDGEVYYSKSSDGGSTWDAPVEIGGEVITSFNLIADPGSENTQLFLPVWVRGGASSPGLKCQTDVNVTLGVTPGIVQIDVAAGGDDDKIEEEKGAIIFGVTPLKSSNEITDNSYLFDWRDDADNRLSLLYNADGEFVLERKASGSGASIEFLEAIVASSPIVVAYRWNATTLGLYMWDGSAWETASVANSSIPTLSATKFDIGSQNQSNGFDAVYDWVMVFDDWVDDETVEHFQELMRHPEPGELSDQSPGEHYRQFALTTAGQVDRVTSTEYPTKQGTRILREAP